MVSLLEGFSVNDVYLKDDISETYRHAGNQEVICCIIIGRSVAWELVSRLLK